MIKGPFIKHEGRWYIIEDWDLGLPDDAVLRLKPLTKSETELLEIYRENFDAEVWALIKGKNQ